MASKTNKNTSTVEQAPAPADTFAGRYSPILARARVLNDADEKRRGQDPAISLQRSYSFWLLANGVSKDAKLTKAEKASHQSAWQAYAMAYANDRQVAVSVGGSAAAVKVTNVRYTEIDRESGVPSARTMTLQASTRLSKLEQAEWCQNQSAAFQRHEARLRAEAEAEKSANK